MSHVTIGNNLFRGQSTPILFKDQDRLRHMYMIGKTGVGKSSLFANMALQDINSLKGLCFIDPHCEAISWLLERIPQSRMEDVILFDPSDVENPLGLNLLVARTEAERDFLVSELIEIFYKLFENHLLLKVTVLIYSHPSSFEILQVY